MKMAKRPLVEFILQVINFVFTVWGLGKLCYGLVCLFKWKQSSSKEFHESNIKFMIVHRLLLAVDPAKFSSDILPRAWFIYLIIGIGAILFIISCLGYVGTASRSPCCLFSYCVFLVALVIVELVTAAFIFFEHNWKDVIPQDRSGSFHTIYHFVSVNWTIIRWMALGVFILQVIAMVLAVNLRSVFNRAWHDRSDGDEHIVDLPPSAMRQNYRMLKPIRDIPSTITTANHNSDSTKPSKL